MGHGCAGPRSGKSTVHTKRKLYLKPTPTLPKEQMMRSPSAIPSCTRLYPPPNKAAALVTTQLETLLPPSTEVPRVFINPPPPRTRTRELRVHHFGHNTKKVFQSLRELNRGPFMTMKAPLPRGQDAPQDTPDLACMYVEGFAADRGPIRPPSPTPLAARTPRASQPHYVYVTFVVLKSQGRGDFTNQQTCYLIGDRGSAPRPATPLH